MPRLTRALRQIPKFVKNFDDLAFSKVAVAPHYYRIMGIYKHYCTSSGSNPFSMQWNAFTELCQSINVCDARVGGRTVS